MSDLLNDFKSKASAMKPNGKFTSSCKDICLLLFKSQLETHLTHILQKSKKLSTHKALETYYDDIDDLVDTLMETSMGLYPITDAKISSVSAFDDPVAYFNTLYTTINTLRQPITESFLQNQIDEVQQLISHTLYRLKYVQ